jgi:hypothetical protein
MSTREDSQNEPIDGLLESMIENPGNPSQLPFSDPNSSPGQSVTHEAVKRKKKKRIESAPNVLAKGESARPRRTENGRDAPQRRWTSPQREAARNHELLCGALRSAGPFTQLRFVRPEEDQEDSFGGALRALGPFMQLHFPPDADEDNDAVFVHYDEEDIDGVVVHHEKEDDGGIIVFSDEDDASDDDSDFEVID